MTGFQTSYIIQEQYTLLIGKLNGDKTTAHDWNKSSSCSPACRLVSLDYQHGSHVYLRHPERPNMRVTVPVHSGEVIKPKTLQSILKQAGLSVNEFQELL